MTVYFSEIDHLGGAGNEFIEVAAPAGLDVSGYSVYLYAADGTVDSGPYSLGSAQGTMHGQDVYLLDHANSGLTGVHGEDGFALVDDTGTVVQFISMYGNVITATEGPANGLSSRSVGDSDPGGSIQSDDGGSTYFAQSSSNAGSVPCFARGTLIETPGGARAVEKLKVGDPVLTLDCGPLPVTWIRQWPVRFDGARADQRPVLVRRGALGPQSPARDLIVSPQHRLLAANGVLIPAKALTGLPGVRFMTGRRDIVWVHFAFARHQIVRANGAWTESLLVAEGLSRALPVRERLGLRRIFGRPDAAGRLNGPPARACLTVGQGRRALAL